MDSSGNQDGEKQGEQPPITVPVDGEVLAAVTTALVAAGFAVEPEGDVLVIAAGAIASLAEKLGKVTSDFEAARDRADKLQAKLDKADKAPRERTGGKAAKPRSIGPVDDQPDPHELLKAIRDAGEAELAFAGKGREVALPPRIVSGDAWVITAIGLKLHLPELIVEGPGPQALEIDGYGLFLDGKQVAYAARHDQLQLAAGRRMNLKDDVIFAG